MSNHHSNLEISPSDSPFLEGSVKKGLKNIFCWNSYPIEYWLDSRIELRFTESQSLELVAAFPFIPFSTQYMAQPILASTSFIKKKSPIYNRNPFCLLLPIYLQTNHLYIDFEVNLIRTSLCLQWLGGLFLPVPHQT